MEEAVLAMFEAAGWPRLVPFVPDPKNGLEKERVHNAISNLNRRVRPHLHFWQEASGTRIGWEPVKQ